MLLEMNVKLRRGCFNLSTQLFVDDQNIGLLGHAGAGKSTLLGLIVGTIQPQSGYIILDGKILYDSRKGIVMPREQRPIGAVLQRDNNTHFQETVQAHLTSVYERTLTQRRLFSVEFLSKVLELKPFFQQRIESLSAEERLRVAVARSLLKSPKLLLLDDTFAMLSDSYRTQLLPILKRLPDELSLPVVYASQSLGEILELTDQLVVLEQGRVLRSGSLRELAKRNGMFRHLGIRQVDNILSVRIRGHEPYAGYSVAESLGLHLALPLRAHLALNTPMQISIRANDIALARHYLEGISIQNQLKGRICALIPCGESVLVQVDCGCTLLVEITPYARRDLALQEGDTIYCLIKTHSIVYLHELEALPFQRVVNYQEGYYLNSF